MRAFVLESYGQLRMRELEEPGRSGLLVRVACCGVCGSDVAVYLGKEAMRERWEPPLVLGHEVSGVVEEGPGEWVGRGVAVNPLVSCGDCRACRAGRENLCRRRRHIGFHEVGGFAERIRVPVQQLVPLPVGVEVWKGALAEPLAVALRVEELAGPGDGRQALVVGGGGIGALVAWALGRVGWRVCVAERSSARRSWLEGLGVAEEIGGGFEGREFELVVDAVGSAESVEGCLERTGAGGRIIVVGLGQTRAPVRLSKIVTEEIAVVGSYTYSRATFCRAVSLLMELPAWPWSRRRMEEAGMVMRELAAGQVAAGRVLLCW